MTRIEIQPADDDSGEFIEAVNAVIRGIALHHAPSELVLVKIDNWFGPKWLGFKGRLLGALSLWNRTTLTVPPFAPKRVRWQQRLSGPAYDIAKVGPALHVAMRSAEALRRRVSEVAPGAALVWFSGNSAANRRGALMSYLPAEDSYWAWYTGWQWQESWRPLDLKGISTKELAALSRAG